MTANEKQYAELADETKSLKMYRSFHAAAEARRDNAVAEEEENIAHETGRIEAAEARIRELVKELGLA